MTVWLCFLLKPFPKYTPCAIQAHLRSPYYKLSHVAAGPNWLVMLTLEGRGEWQGTRVYSKVLSRVSSWPVCVRAEHLSVAWAVSVTKVSYPQSWHRPVSGKLLQWISSWPALDAIWSNMMDHLSSYVGEDGCRVMRGVQARRRWQASQNTEKVINEATILCENIWL